MADTAITRRTLVPVPFGARVGTSSGAAAHRPAPAGTGSGPLGTGSGALGTGSGALGTGSGALGTKSVGLGYHPDLPDFRDRAFGGIDFVKTAAGKLLQATAQSTGKQSHLLDSTQPLPARVHLGDASPMPPIEDQGQMQSCTANAAVGMAEYLILRSGEDQLDLSRMFLYKVTRRLLGWTGDTGAYIRTTLKSMVLFGVPPESDWPYDAQLVDIEPEAFHYAYAENFKAMSYARLDGSGALAPGFSTRGEQTLDTLKRTLADGFPAAFGFPVYRSIGSMGSNFVIPLPIPGTDVLIGGHAVLAVGYDDSIPCAQQTSPGALIIRNSWGETWGDHGYAY
ncbi:MAG TPA: C1 family peptidase, partial [Candidatus Binatia bacterium]|nr:C1 family peptidase [Candidatus Binatia bacterium]